MEIRTYLDVAEASRKRFLQLRKLADGPWEDCLLGEWSTMSGTFGNRRYQCRTSQCCRYVAIRITGVRIVAAAVCEEGEQVPYAIGRMVRRVEDLGGEWIDGVFDTVPGFDLDAFWRGYDWTDEGVPDEAFAATVPDAGVAHEREVPSTPDTDEHEPKCRCSQPPFWFEDFDTKDLGTDNTKGRSGEVSLEQCRHCGAYWLRYFVEPPYRASAHWYRGLITVAQAQEEVTPSNAADLLAVLPWHFRGGSYFKSLGRLVQGGADVDEYRGP